MDYLQRFLWKTSAQEPDSPDIRKLSLRKVFMQDLLTIHFRKLAGLMKSSQIHPNTTHAMKS